MIEKINKTIEPDILIIPLLAFDKSLSRLGMGGGFFDRTIQYLRSQNSQLITIGLAYDFQEFDEFDIFLEGLNNL